MEDPIFDAIFALCDAAEQDGYVAVADALELVLDVYLLEREQRQPVEPADPMFHSRRSRSPSSPEIAEWTAALHDDPQAHSDPVQKPPRPMPRPSGEIAVGWSSTEFPLARVAQG